MICILGDIHFNSSKDYFRAISEEFLKWFKNWKYNTSNNALILAGDLVQDSLNGGVVIQYLERLYQYSNFKEIHVVVGNHDLKKINNIPQLAYDFYRYKKNVYVYEEASEVVIDNKKVLVLPYFTGLNKYGVTMSEYYSNIYKNPSFTNNYDLVVGHFTGEDCAFPGAVDCVYNLDKLTGKVCLGHIHTRKANPSRYIGSIYAGNKAENDYTRSAWLMLETGDVKEERLPIFNEFITVTYPDTLPATDALVPIYTILNCTSESVAHEKYGDIYIRKITGDKFERGSVAREDLERQFNSIRHLDTRQLFEAFATSRDIPYSEDVLEKCRQALSKLI